MKLMEDIIKFIDRTSDEGRPMICKIALVNTKDGTRLNDFVSLWAGIGESSPLERLKQLKAQRDEYERQLKLIADKYPLSEDDKEMIATTVKYFNL